jgi:hypothetical protein
LGDEAVSGLLLQSLEALTGYGDVGFPTAQSTFMWLRSTSEGRGGKEYRSIG